MLRFTVFMNVTLLVFVLLVVLVDAKDNEKSKKAECQYHDERNYCKCIMRNCWLAKRRCETQKNTKEALIGCVKTKDKCMCKCNRVYDKENIFPDNCGKN